LSNFVDIIIPQSGVRLLGDGHRFGPVQEADWFRHMLRTHLMAMHTVKQLTQDRGAAAVQILVNLFVGSLTVSQHHRSPIIVRLNRITNPFQL
jgi:hypothetical protein